MFCKYVYNAGITVNTLLDDIGKICSAPADSVLADLNLQGCNTGLSTLYSTVAGGWTVIERADRTMASTSNGNSFPTLTMSAPVIDGGKAKIAGFRVFAAGATSGSPTATMVCAEDFNAGAGTFTNPCAINDTASVTCQTLSLSAGGTLFISASARRLLINTPSGLLSYYNHPSYVLERPRGLNYWDTLAANYPLSVIGNTYSIVTGYSTASLTRTPRFRNIITNQDALPASNSYDTCCVVAAWTHGGNSWQNSNTARFYDASGQVAYHVTKLVGVTLNNGAGFVGDLSDLNDVYVLQRGYGAQGDEILVDGKWYFVYPMHSQSNALGSILMPLE